MISSVVVSPARLWPYNFPERRRPALNSIYQIVLTVYSSCFAALRTYNTGCPEIKPPWSTRSLHRRAGRRILNKDWLSHDATLGHSCRFPKVIEVISSFLHRSEPSFKVNKNRSAHYSDDFLEEWNSSSYKIWILLRLSRPEPSFFYLYLTYLNILRIFCKIFVFCSLEIRHYLQFVNCYRKQ